MQLREELGPRVMMARELPPKWSLLGVNRKPELIEKRRRELEVWLWKLIADPDIARSRVRNHWLELTDGARMVTKCAPLPPACRCTSSGPHGPVGCKSRPFTGERPCVVWRRPRLSPASSVAPSRNGAGSVASRTDAFSFAASDATRSDADESGSEASYAATGKGLGRIQGCGRNFAVILIGSSLRHNM